MQYPSNRAAAPLDLLRAEVSAYLRPVPRHQHAIGTAIPYLSFIRYQQPTELQRGMLEPSLCLILQGRKKILIGREVIDYGIGSYVLAAVDMPTSGQVTRASEAEPYVGLRLELEAREIAALILEFKLAPSRRKPGAGACVDEASADFQETLLRLVRLLNTPGDIPVLSQLIKKEILYRLLSSENGSVLFENLTSYNQQKGINEAIRWIKTHYAEPMKIEALAEVVGMSVSTLHHRFKAITTMSPLQYQKQIRLLEARKLLLAANGNLEAATVAFQVGYESPSQFSREYRRLFGAPPMQDSAAFSALGPGDFRARFDSV